MELSKDQTVGLNQARLSRTTSREANFEHGKDQILTAVVAAKGRITKLGKNGQNLEQGYVFASIDAFLELVNPICAETGLIVLMDEVSVEEVHRLFGGIGQDWLWFHYEITLMHISGQFLGPFKRHVEVPRTGAQAFGSAQSYALKQFLRAQFQIATGEMDDPDFGTSAAEEEQFAQRLARKTADAKKDHLSTVARIDSVAGQLAQRISEAASGRELLAILGGLSDECRNMDKLTVARIGALRRIVTSAASTAALEKLEKYFRDDWPQVHGLAERRRSELLFASEGPGAHEGRTTADMPVKETSAPAEPKPAVVRLTSENSVDIDFGDIPYSEAAA